MFLVRHTVLDSTSTDLMPVTVNEEGNGAKVDADDDPQTDEAGGTEAVLPCGFFSCRG